MIIPAPVSQLGIRRVLKSDQPAITAIASVKLQIDSVAVI
jgi:hypothetical protein